MNNKDTIYRQVAIDAAIKLKVDEEEYCTDYDLGFNDGISEVVKMLYAFPSAEPGWIPVTERLSEKVMLKVPNRQDPYNVIGQYIQNHVTVIEYIIATIELDGVRTNELFMVDMQEDGYFVWNSDWYEGEQNVALIDFFPVSDAEPERKTRKRQGVMRNDK